MLQIMWNGRRWRLDRGRQLTIGRDVRCDICVDPDDVGISRIAARITGDGAQWFISNVSRKRSLHVIDGSGFAVPLPASAGGVESRRAVDPPEITLLVVGDVWTHKLSITVDPAPGGNAPATAPPDGRSTRTQLPPLPDERREVMVALARGYLKPYPQYHPHPHSYQDVATLLGLAPEQVSRHVEAVGHDLTASGVPIPQDHQEVRRALCEWLLAARLITPADEEWLKARITLRPIHDEITRIAERTAAAIAASLLARLRQVHGDDWLAAGNQSRPPKHRLRRQDLRDYRVCLAILGHDPVAHGWVSEACRRDARALNQLANMASHRDSLRQTDADRALKLAEDITRCVPPPPASGGL